MTEQFDEYEKLYHSEIHGSKERKILSQSQCKYLAKMARVCIT